MSRMCELERVCGHRRIGLEQREDGVEVRLILLAGVLRLEQEGDLGALVGNAVGGVRDDLRSGATESRIAATDPRVAVPRLANGVQPPRAGVGVPKPGLVALCERRFADRNSVRRRSRRPPAPRARRESHGTLARERRSRGPRGHGSAGRGRDRRPPGDDRPRHFGAGEPAYRFSRLPGIPRRGRARSPRAHSVQIQRRQRRGRAGRAST